MDSNIYNEFLRLYEASCVALFETYEIDIILERKELVSLDKHSLNYISILNATAEGVSLGSILRLEPDVLRASYPSGTEGISQGDLEDWCRELNNQLMGRFKNKLLASGCELTMGLPLLFTGENITNLPSSDHESHECFFGSTQGPLMTGLIIKLAEDFTFKAPESLTKEDIPEEGSFFLFD